MTSALGKVKKYEITTEKDTYWLGEVVRGSLKLSCQVNIKDNGVAPRDGVKALLGLKRGGQVGNLQGEGEAALADVEE